MNMTDLTEVQMDVLYIVLANALENHSPTSPDRVPSARSLASPDRVLAARELLDAVYAETLRRMAV